MTGQLANLLNISNDFLWHGIAVFLRVGALVALLPAFGERTVPARIKLVIVLCFVLIVAPAIRLTDRTPSFDTLTLLVMTETLAGFLLGIGIRLFVLALQTAGSIAAQSTSLSQILGGAVSDPLPAMGYILIIAGLALVTITGLHIKAASLIILSYDLLPMGQFPGGSTVSTWGVSRIAQAFGLAFTLAAPFVILSIIYNLTLGAINKAMPQLMVAFVGAPVITAGGLFVLALASPFMLQHWMQALDAYLANPFRMPP
ncbi:Flagellar biosynthetic protein FliR [Sulfitobacter noctilucae]|uniref:flagellar biosynthetic protein FliR n=1 Tax=Sulfitobacter noctilucae TaxID=1342302 RepID=UPI0004692B02|nr:flagellar biosynthetic protein FliR [Sulfitobacter noctilucae]KIN65930.1 Flagellar biosynthetic protein FliR [Sulfitobacter noctilucae]